MFDVWFIIKDIYFYKYMNKFEKYATSLKNICFEEYYFGTNLFYDEQLLKSFKVRFPDGVFPWKNNTPIYIMTCKTPIKKYIICCCQLGGNIRGNIHTIWNLFKTLEAENLKGVCFLFINLLSLYYKKKYGENGEKQLNLYIIVKYSKAAYKSYIKSGFVINNKNSFWLYYRNNQEYALHMVKN
jgi:hypothetical protein